MYLSRVTVTLGVQLVLMMAVVAAAASDVSDGDSRCTTSGISSCGECISQHYTCAWCSMKNFTVKEPHDRCRKRSSLKARGCLDMYIEEPSDSIDINENNPVKDSPAVQLQPQTMSMKVRTHKPMHFNVTFRAANNYPVDFYFLFDLSRTMKDLIKTFANVAEVMGQEISKETKNFAMAYGSFQDKVTMPFTNTMPETLADACAGRGGSCGAPFDFRHLHKMTTETGEIIDRVKASEHETTGNLDHPEGGLEAIVQAITCKEQVAWREKARKLLIYASDDRFHLAGDGRLGGIVIPNDMQCHLEKQQNFWKYTAGLEQDYPSVGQLSNLIQTEDIHVIFIVDDKTRSKYDLLSERIPNSKVSTVKSGEQIKKLVVDKYKSIVSKVDMTFSPKQIPGVEIEITTKSECENTKGKEGNNVCEGIEIGQEIEFDVKVTVTECPVNEADRHKTIHIFPNNLQHDKLTLELELVCECECYKNVSQWEEDSDLCSQGNGTLKCGVCDCHDGRRGDVCECAAHGTGLEVTSSQKCVSDDGKECSGNGECDCGKCICQPDFSGSKCECVQSDCEEYQGERCGGKKRGNCNCGKCVCEPEYTGSSCECPTSNSSCIYEDKVCSGHGQCQCGECHCQSQYGAKYCQKCVLCGNICDDAGLRACAICKQSKQTTEDCSEKCADTEGVTMVEEIEIDDNATHKCHHQLPDTCTLVYEIDAADPQKLQLKVVKTKSCPEPLDVVPIVSGIIGGVVLLALLLLLIGKIITVLYDRREYSRFNEDLKNCRWAQTDNPVYKEATTKYINPMMDTGGHDDAPMKE